eukprot:4383045-Pyramimonas_sp.AAC.1
MPSGSLGSRRGSSRAESCGQALCILVDCTVCSAGRAGVICRTAATRASSACSSSIVGSSPAYNSSAPLH